MVRTQPVLERKVKYAKKLEALLGEYKSILLCSLDFVGSNQLQQVRISLRGKAIVLMGKNTIIRKVMREYASKPGGKPELLELLPFIIGNVGFVFTNGDLSEVRKIIVSNKIPAAAKPGVKAICDVVVPAGPTPLDPGQTSFFQALNIATKITKGAVEIINETRLITCGERVSSSAVALLAKLNVKPFFFGVIVNDVYDNGDIYSASVLDMSQDDIRSKFLAGVSIVAALSLATHIPTKASLPHLVINGFKKLLAISLATNYTFKQAKTYKDLLADPSKLAALKAAPAAAPAAAAAGKKAPEAKKAAEPEPEEEDKGAAFSLFD